MQLYKHNTSCDGTHKQAGGQSVDATLFAEELAEIYSTPTPNAMAKAKVKSPTKQGLNQYHLFGFHHFISSRRVL